MEQDETLLGHGRTILDVPSVSSWLVLMMVKQNKKQSHRLNHPRSGRLHVAAMSLTGDERSSGPMSFLGKERQRETLQGRKEVAFVSIFMFILRPDALSLNGSVMINQSINQSINQFYVLSRNSYISSYSHITRKNYKERVREMQESNGE